MPTADITGRDAAEFVEAVCHPVIPDDSLVDEMREIFEAGGIEALAKWHLKKNEHNYGIGFTDGVAKVAITLWPQPGERFSGDIRFAALAILGNLDCVHQKSMNQIAKEFGCTRAAISKEKNKWADRLGLRTKDNV